MRLLFSSFESLTPVGFALGWFKRAYREIQEIQPCHQTHHTEICSFPCCRCVSYYA